MITFKDVFHIIDTFFEGIAQGTIKKSSVAAVLISGTSPIPLAAMMLIYFMMHTEVSNALAYESLNHFFLVGFSFTAACLLLGLLGFWIREHQQFSYLYILLVAQVFGIGTYCLIYFLGVFSSPILLTILMSTGVGAVIFDKWQLLAALGSIFCLATLTAVLQNLDYISVLPIVKNMALAEEYLWTWYIYVYALVIPVLSILFSLIVRALMQEYREKHQQLEALALKLAKYLSPQVYNSIFSSDTDVHIETYRKKLSVFFSDLKGFTSLTDEMNSEQLSLLLNSYLNEMSAIALKHGGTIDKFVGDSIMIFFGDPESEGEKQDALNCVKMALEMRSKVEALKQDWKSQGIHHPVSLRVGINTGYCTVGNFGSDNRVDYTIIGGQVNLASRLLYSASDNSILISHETYGLVNEEISCVKKEKINVKGIHRAIQTYEVDDEFSNIAQHKQELDTELKSFLETVKNRGLNELQKQALLDSLKAKLN